MMNTGLCCEEPGLLEGAVQARYLYHRSVDGVDIASICKVDESQVPTIETARQLAVIEV